eukprot:2606619-Prymnesium_polylepis.1
MRPSAGISHVLAGAPSSTAVNESRRGNSSARRFRLPPLLVSAPRGGDGMATLLLPAVIVERVDAGGDCLTSPPESTVVLEDGESPRVKRGTPIRELHLVRATENGKAL